MLVLSNFVMQKISIFLSDFEGHFTNTNLMISVAFKLTFVKSLNLALIPLINSWDFSNWFVEYGLIEDCFYNILFYIIGEISLTAIDATHYVKILQRWWEKRKGENSSMT